MGATIIESLLEDNDDSIFAVTVHTHNETLKHVTAMVLIEKSGEVYINEAARDRLKEMWKESYAVNMRKLLPSFVLRLDEGRIPINGIKTMLQA